MTQTPPDWATEMVGEVTVNLSWWPPEVKITGKSRDERSVALLRGYAAESFLEHLEPLQDPGEPGQPLVS